MKSLGGKRAKGQGQSNSTVSFSPKVFGCFKFKGPMILVRWLSHGQRSETKY